MPKLSIYVPDELWDQVRETAGDRNPSQLIQDALSRAVSVGQIRRTRFAETPSVDPERLGSISADLRADADAVYRAGYKAGLTISQNWPWEAIDWFSEHEFDPDRISKEKWEEVEEFIGRDLKSDLWAVNDLVYEGQVYKLGRQRAFRDVWQMVTSDGDPSAE